jgi:hypothetical protein
MFYLHVGRDYTTDRDPLKILILFVTSYSPVCDAGIVTASVIEQRPITNRDKREANVAAFECERLRRASEHTHVNGRQY